MSAADIVALAKLAHRAPVKLTVTDDRGVDYEFVIPAGSTPADVAALLAPLS